MADCVGCGYCCKKAPCAFGVKHFGYHDPPCKGLVHNEGRYWCLLVTNALNGVGPWPLEEVMGSLAIGEGCCSSLNSSRRDMLRSNSSLTSYVR